MFNILPILFGLLVSPANAQNVTCATRPNGDASNACASTAFVANPANAKFPTFACPASQWVSSGVAGAPVCSQPAASNISYNNGATGAGTISAQTVFARTVSIDDFAAAHDGTTNDATPLNNAMTALGAQGGVVNLSCAYNYYIGSNITIPANVTVRHCRGAGWFGNPGIDWTTGPIGSQPHIRLSSSVSITLSSNSGFEGVILRSGATFPTSNASAYAGTAIKLPVGSANDTKINALIVGFAVCVDGTTGGDRYDWNIECDGNPGATSGAVIIGPSYDSSRAKIRTYPWGTAAGATPTNTRTGYGIQILSGAQDDSRLDLFDYGHAKGIVTAANGNVHYRHVWADNNSSYGVHIFGNDKSSFDFISSTTSAGIRVENSAAINIGYYLCDTGSVASAECLEVADGISAVVNIGFFDVKKATLYAINLGGTASRVNIAAGNLTNINGGVGPYIVGPANWTADQVILGPSVVTDLANGSSLKGGNPVQFNQLASASPLTLPVFGTDFYVTGTTSFSNITGAWGGRRVRLIFDNALTVSNSSTILLANARSFVTSQGSVLEIEYDHAAGAWREISRSPLVSADVGSPAPATKTANYTADSAGAKDASIIFNGSGSLTLTLPTASANTGRVIRVKTIAAFTVISASSNVVPLAGGAASTAILAATAGKWADLQSDGTNWIIMASN